MIIVQTPWTVKDESTLSAVLAEARRTLREIDLLLASQDVELEDYALLNSKFHDQLARMAQSTVLAREIARMTALPLPRHRPSSKISARLLHCIAT